MPLPLSRILSRQRICIIANLDFDPIRFSMVECVAQSLRRNPVDFIPNNGMKGSRHAFDNHLKIRSLGAGDTHGEFIPKRSDRVGEIAGEGC